MKKQKSHKIRHKSGNHIVSKRRIALKVQTRKNQPKRRLRQGTIFSKGICEVNSGFRKKKNKT